MEKSMSLEEMKAQASKMMTTKKVVIVVKAAKAATVIAATSAGNTAQYFGEPEGLSIGEILNPGKKEVVTRPLTDEEYTTKLLVKDFKAREAWKREHFPN